MKRYYINLEWLERNQACKKFKKWFFEEYKPYAFINGACLVVTVIDIKEIIENPNMKEKWLKWLYKTLRNELKFNIKNDFINVRDIEHPFPDRIVAILKKNGYYLEDKIEPQKETIKMLKDDFKRQIKRLKEILTKRNEENIVLLSENEKNKELSANLEIAKKREQPMLEQIEQLENLVHRKCDKVEKLEKKILELQVKRSINYRDEEIEKLENELVLFKQLNNSLDEKIAILYDKNNDFSRNNRRMEEENKQLKANIMRAAENYVKDIYCCPFRKNRCLYCKENEVNR